MSLIKYTPFADFDNFPSGLRVFQDSVNRLFAEPGSRPWVPAVDIEETDHELVVKADEFLGPCEPDNPLQQSQKKSFLRCVQLKLLALKRNSLDSMIKI